jgi:hypothetical protein
MTADLRIIHGALHDQAGWVSTLLPQTPAARKWLIDVMDAQLDGVEAALIETDNTGLVIDCAERDGLTVKITDAA